MLCNKKYKYTLFNKSRLFHKSEGGVHTEKHKLCGSIMYGVIDIGSNTVRLSVFKKTDTGITSMLHAKSTAGLASYVDKKGNLTENGIKRAIEVLSQFRNTLSNIEVKEIFVFATASLRNVANTAEAIHQIESSTGFKIDLVSGEDEALYDFTAVTHYMKIETGLMVDIGGGSTELVFYRDKNLRKALSAPIGSLNSYMRNVKDVLPSDSEVDKIREDIKKAIEHTTVKHNYDIICGVGGTVRSSYKLYTNLFKVKEEKGGTKEFTTEQLSLMIKMLLKDRKLAVEKIIKSAPDRIHTIIPGMIILETIANHYNMDKIAVCDYGIREGYLYSKLFSE